MPRGKKPKVYDDSLVADVDRLYRAGRTQSEIGKELGLSQKVVWNLMRRHGLAPRTAAKRNQFGPLNHMWKGDTASYTAMHYRLTHRYGQPKVCAECGATDPSLTYDWANLTGNYADISDYRRMCRSCHRRYDNIRGKGEEVPSCR